ncbi:MAG: response regulator, partial [bacterium]
MAKILVIDDEAKMALLVSGALEDAGHSVAVAHNGAAGLEILTAGGIDMVVTDLKMDPPDGLAILRHVSEKLPEVGVILMTAFATAESAVSAMKAGAYDYLIKPFSL